MFNLDEYDGGICIEKLSKSRCTHITSEPGIYIVKRDSNLPPKFLKEGTGGFFKNQNPNVSIETLENKWISNAEILYIGKATNLKKRIWQYIQFGKGVNIGHRGGRYIWQLEDNQALIIYWRILKDQDPREEEKRSLDYFRTCYGKLPFANLKL